MLVAKQTETGAVAEGAVTVRVNSVYCFGSGIQQEVELFLRLPDLGGQSFGDAGGIDTRIDHRAHQSEQQATECKATGQGCPCRQVAEGG